jgi:tetratricopeptide (TPR) repeat protein
MSRMRLTVWAAMGAAAVLSGTADAHASAESIALRARASDEFYNLDREQALATFKQAIAADAQDAGAYRGLASVLWLSITFQRGNMTVDDYLGRVTRPNTQMPPAPPDTVAAFRSTIDRALALSRAHIAANARDADAHYQLGAAVGLRASYSATVDGSVLGAFRAAREAYDEHEKVLEIDPRRKDAGLIVGTYRYVVSALALPLRLMAYVVGFGGGREKGLELVEGAASYPGENQADARFALILLYNREKRYDDALKQLATLRERYPRNRLVWLESGSTCLRAGRWADADRFLTDGWARFEPDKRPRMFGEDALWQYKIGAARAGLGRAVEARAALDKALSLPGRMWVHGRSHLELGKLALNAANRRDAKQHFQAAVALCENDNDEVSADEARRLLGRT